MAPPRKASVQKEGRVTRTPPETPRNAMQSRNRSASPPNQPTPIRIRDEPPARSTRSWVSAPPVSNITPTASQRIPIGCPIIGCRASTVHQHLPQMQYYHPHPGRAVHYHGYGNSSRDASSRPSLVVSPGIARQAQSTTRPGPEVAKDEVVAEQNGEEQGAGMSDVEFAEEQAASREVDDLQDATTLDGPAVEPSLQDQQRAMQQEENTFLDGDEREIFPSANALPISLSLSVGLDLDVDRESVRDVDGVQHLLPEQTRDLTHDESTTSLLQAPMTPPPSSPVAADEAPFTQDSNGSPEQQEQRQSAASSAPRMGFGDSLPGQEPEESVPDHPTPHIHTYDELVRPFIDPTLPPAPSMGEITRILQEYQSSTDPSYRPGADEEDPDLPSRMMRSPVTEYIRQFEDGPEEEIDWETHMWQ